MDYVKKAAYNRAYYQKTKEARSKRQKLLYANSEEERSKRAARRKVELARLRVATRIRQGKNPEKSRRKHKGKKVYILLPDGSKRETFLLTKGQLAYRVGIISKTVDVWHKKEILPIPIYFTKCGHKRYTVDQVQGLKEIYEHYKKLLADNGEPWYNAIEFVDDIRSYFDSLVNGVLPEG